MIEMRLNFVEGNRIGYINDKTFTHPPKSKQVLLVKISCGGGMGGSSWNEVVEPPEEIKPNTLQDFRTVEGEEITVNTAYVVKISHYDLVTVYYRTFSKDFLIKSNVDWVIVDEEMESDICRESITWEVPRYKDAPTLYTKGEVV